MDWIRTDNQGIFEGGNQSFEPIVRSFVDNPLEFISTGGHQVNRNLDGELHRVYFRGMHQRWVVDHTSCTLLQANSEGIERQEFPPQLFWKVIPEHLVEIDHPPHLSQYVGYIGYLGYELSRLLEKYAYRDDWGKEPLLILEFPTEILVHTPHNFHYLQIDLPTLPRSKLSLTGHQHSAVRKTVTFNDYIASIRNIKEHIVKGDIYQANYTQQFSVPAPSDPLELYRMITNSQNLPHAAYLTYNDFHVLSLSPELFIRIENGVVTTKPIKGTRPRGASPQEDQRLMGELSASEKDLAELSMIVDLLRNDIGKSSLSGSVEVVDHAVIESYENVHHLVSTIRAQIKPNFQASWRLLLRALPGGSISGVPKIRALEIIEQEEIVPRGIYTGNIGFLGLSGDFELNIAIRTITINAESAVFHAGGGIVYDSDPLEEYLESLYKARHIVNYLGSSFAGHLQWFDGEMINSTDEVIPTTEGGFETILVTDGVISHLEDHRRRLERTIEYYNLDVTLPDTTVIQQFLSLNLANQGRFRLNISAWRDQESHILMKISPYVPPKFPLALIIYPDAITVPEAVTHGLKSLDYSSYSTATQLAMDTNAWDSIIFDTDSNLLEGGRSTIYLLIEG
ncbi:MAG: bifunctional anthranilate synthase component I family protein/class IV aminotransferase, partial [Candidatus Kariarchaeaceae archaeon]